MSKKTFMTQKKRTSGSRQHRRGCRSYHFRLGHKLGAVLVAIGLGTILLLVAEFSGRKPLNVQEKTFLQSYENIRSKLAYDDLDGARAESSLLVQFPGSRVATAAQTIADSDTLEQARLGFVAMSEQAILIAQNRKGYYVMYCPPVGCPQHCESCPMSKFGDWVQIDSRAENPFVGTEQSRCGIARN